MLTINYTSKFIVVYFKSLYSKINIYKYSLKLLNKKIVYCLYSNLEFY